MDIKENLEDVFNEKCINFTAKSGYYNAYLHQKYCKLCNLPEKVREKLNEMILSGKPNNVIKLFLLEQFPDYFSGQRINKQIENHRKYLPLLINDVKFKSIFKRAKHITDNLNEFELSDIEKAKVITEIESKLMEEYSDIENERISLVNVMFKEMMPLIVTKLRQSIISGSPKEIKYITDSSSALFRMSKEIAEYNINSIKEEKEEEKPLDFDTIEENNSTQDDMDTIKSNVVSLRDKIDEAIGNG